MQETAEQYISRILGYVEGQDAIKVQRATVGKLKKLIQGLSPTQLKWRPEPAKWSIAEIIAHLADTEIVASWRMRSVIGENGITIQPFDQDAWASAFEYRDRDARPKQAQYHPIPRLASPRSAFGYQTRPLPFGGIEASKTISIIPPVDPAEVMYSHSL